jgi:GNAT superfamily N-acetyltransferase
MTQPIATLAERPELEAQIPRLHAESWPAFIQADPIAVRYWGELFATFAEYQYLLCDDDGSLIAAGHAIPLVWDGSMAGLPGGWDAALEAGFQDYEQGRVPNTLCPLSIVISPASQGKGISEMMLRMMKEIAITDGLKQLIMPVRPSLKSRHPRVPIEEYLQWRQPDGSAFDPWMRIYQRMGAEILAIAPRSMVVTGTLSQWEAWTGMRFPTSGTYEVAGALVPIVIDHERDSGLYEEPNVWMRYMISAA